jgi:hypothetical protein
MYLKEPCFIIGYMICDECCNAYANVGTVL